MEEEGNKSGNYLKMNPTDAKTVKVLTEAVEGINEFQGKTRPEFRMEVQDLVTQERLIWAIRQKNVMQQLIGIMKANRLSSLVGQVVQINTAGQDAMKKVWFLQLVRQQAPSATPQQPTAPQQDPGQAWIQGQMQDMAAPGAR
jgi:hypothetical protein